MCYIYIYICMYPYMSNKIPVNPDKWYIPHNNSLLLISLTGNVKISYLRFYIRFIFIVNHYTTDGCTQHRLHKEENSRSCITTESTATIVTIKCIDNNAQNINSEIVTRINSHPDLWLY